MMELGVRVGLGPPIDHLFPNIMFLCVWFLSGNYCHHFVIGVTWMEQNGRPREVISSSHHGTCDSDPVKHHDAGISAWLSTAAYIL